MDCMHHSNAAVCKKAAVIAGQHLMQVLDGADPP